jgi:hypothetical protein
LRITVFSVTGQEADLWFQETVNTCSLAEKWQKFSSLLTSKYSLFLMALLGRPGGAGSQSTLCCPAQCLEKFPIIPVWMLGSGVGHVFFCKSGPVLQTICSWPWWTILFGDS